MECNIAKKAAILHNIWLNAGSDASAQLKSIIATWRLRIGLNKLDKELLKIARRSDEHKMRQYEEELDEAVRYADSAAQYRIVRKVCNTMKSNRRKLAHMPRIRPQRADIEDKYKQHPHQGGWMAATVTEDELDAEEPDFKEISVFQHEETLYLLDRLAEQYIRSPNRKSYVPGDVPKEAGGSCSMINGSLKGIHPNGD